MGINELEPFSHEWLMLIKKVILGGISVIVKTITGLFPLTITDAIGGNALDYSIEGNMGRFVKVGEMMYPITDDAVEILDSFTNNNISTILSSGIKPRKYTNFKVVAEFSQTISGVSHIGENNGYWFGASTNNTWTIGGSITVGTRTGDIQHFEFTSIRENVSSASGTIKLKVDGVESSERAYSTYLSTDGEFYLVGINNYSGSAVSGVSKFYAIYGDGVLVGYFLPSRKNGVVGVYDLITNTFIAPTVGTLTAGKTTKTVEVGGETIEVPLFSYDMVGDKTANLFNKDNSAILNSFMIHNATVSGNNDNRGFSLKLTEGETYTVAKSNKGRVYIGASVNPFVIGTNDHLPLLVQNSSTSSATFTVPAGKPYIDIVYWHRTNDAGYTESDIRDTLMLVPGSTAPTSHIPYGFEIPITVGQNSPNLLNMEDVYDCGEYEQSIMSDGSLSTDSRNQGLSPWGIGDYEDPTKTTSIMRRMFDRAGTYYVSLIFNEGGVVPSHWTEESPLSCCRFEIEAEDDWFEKYADPTTGSFELTASEITAIQNSTVYFVSVLVHQVTYNANNQANFHIMITRDGVHNEYIPYGGSSETTYKVITQRQLAKVGTYADKASLLNGGEFKVGVTTLSAGTHTLADAKSNGAYITNIPSSGTLSGTSITIPSGYGNVTVVYELATEESEQITAPNITLAEGTNVIDCETEVKPSNGSITYNATST